MDFYKKSCEELCQKIVDRNINNETSLDKFVLQKCNEYCKGKKEEKINDITEKEKKLLRPLYDALKIGGTKCWRIYELLGALEKLSVANVKFFRIFLGVGTGKYYRKAMKDIINDSSNIELFAKDILVNIINKEILVGNIKNDKDLAKKVDAECKKRCKCYLVKEFTRNIKNKIGPIYDLLKKSSDSKGPYKTFIPLDYNQSDEAYEKYIKFLCDLRGESKKIINDGSLLEPLNNRICNFRKIVNERFETMTTYFPQLVSSSVMKILDNKFENGTNFCLKVALNEPDKFKRDKFNLNAKFCEVLKDVFDLLNNSATTFLDLTTQHSEKEYEDYKKFLVNLKSIAKKLPLDSKTINAIDARIKTVNTQINRIAELALTARQTDFENSRGIFNGGNRCYLITALQNLYSNKEFVQKVISAKPPSEKDKDFELFKKLVATKNVFMYLKYGTNEKEFESSSGKWAKDWSQWLGYSGSQQSSEWWQSTVETACRNQMRALKKYLGSSYALELAFQEFRRNRRSNIPTFTSIDDKLLDNKGKALKNILLSLEKNKDKSKIEGNIATWLNTLGYNKESDVNKFIGNISKNIYDKAIAGKSLNQNNVKSTGLSSAISSLTIHQIQGHDIKYIIKHYCNAYANDMPTHNLALTLKNKKFQIIFSDRGHDNPDPRSPKIELDEILDLTKLDLIGTQLLIYDGNTLLDKNKCKFKLISVTIGTGSHYYMYRKVGSQWKEYNDSHVNDVKWDKVKENAGKKAETLVYSL